MLIGEVVNRTGLSKDTIRYYEKLELIVVNRTESDWNNYKEYSEENIKTLLMIKRSKQFGFTLNEIRELLFFLESDLASCSTLITKVDKKLEDIDRRIEELNTMKNTILNKVEAVKNTCGLNNITGNCKTAVKAINNAEK